ncbi:MAG: hypothetical protein KJ967_06230 [Elusimicrobia bacterium]|nr:hypothetical protein [Elusimicrobiota bacterium]
MISVISCVIFFSTAGPLPTLIPIIAALTLCVSSILFIAFFFGLLQRQTIELVGNKLTFRNFVRFARRFRFDRDIDINTVKYIGYSSSFEALAFVFILNSGEVIRAPAIYMLSATNMGKQGKQRILSLTSSKLNQPIYEISELAKKFNQGLAEALKEKKSLEQGWKRKDFKKDVFLTPEGMHYKKPFDHDKLIPFNSISKLTVSHDPTTTCMASIGADGGVNKLIISTKQGEDITLPFYLEKINEPYIFLSDLAGLVNI